MVFGVLLVVCLFGCLDGIELVRLIAMVFSGFGACFGWNLWVGRCVYLVV